MLPLVGLSRPPRRCNKVLFPEPELPIIAMRSPFLDREVYITENICFQFTIGKLFTDVSTFDDDRFSHSATPQLAEFVLPSMMDRWWKLRKEQKQLDQ